MSWDVEWGIALELHAIRKLKLKLAPIGTRYYDKYILKMVLKRLSLQLWTFFEKKKNIFFLNHL